MPDSARPTVPVSAPPAETAAVAGSEPTSWQTGDVVLELYEVRAVFTGGGMGVVYRVRHHGWGTDLAVKRPRPGLLASEADRAEFERVAETWIGLGLHPHIAACHYVRRIDGAPCVFAEYVGGGTLADWVHDGRLYAGGPEAALSRVLDVAIQVARGLAHAHRHGLVHQDVKPGNVLMTADAVAKVTDFGLAGRSSAAGPEADGSLVVNWVGTGTPAYCSPEQARGEPLSAQSDVFSWAVTVLELFTGGVTWPAGPVAGAALDAYLAEPPAAGPPRMPVAVADLLRACLRDDPDHRPHDTHEIETALCRAWEEAEGRAGPRPSPRADPRPADALNNRAVSLVDLGRPAEAVRLWREALRARRDHPEATYNLGLYRWRTGERADPGAPPVPALEWDHFVRELEEVQASYPGEWLPLYLLAQAEMEYGDPEAALDRLGSITGSDADRVEVRALRESARAATTDAERLLYRAPLALCAPQPGGAVFATEDAVGDSLAEAGRLRAAGEHGRAAAVLGAARALPGARRRAELVRAWGELYPHLARTAFRGGWELELLEGHSHPVTAVAISPDGEWVLSGCAGGELRLWETACGRCVWVNRDHGHPVRAVQFGADGRTAITAGGNDKGGREFFWDLTTRKRTRTAHLQNAPYQPDDEASYYVNFTQQDRDVTPAEVVRSLELSADGRFLLWLDAAYRVLLVDTSRWIVTRQSIHEHVPGGTLSVALSPDARFALLSPAWDGSLHLWDLAGGWCVHVVGAGSGAGLPSRVLGPPAHRPIAWSPDGALVLTVGNDFSLRVVGLTDGRCRQVLAGHFDRVTSLAWSGDGRYALSAGEDETVRLWDVETGACLRVFRGHRSGVSAVAFSPDGRFAVSAGRDHTVRLFALDWGLEDRAAADWDEAARPYLSAFLARHAPPVTDETEWARLAGRTPSRCDAVYLVPYGLVRAGRPTWTEPEFGELLAALARSGFSWLRPEGVGRELDRMAGQWDGGLVRFVRADPGPDAEVRLWWRGLEIRDGYLYRRVVSSALTPAVEGVSLSLLDGAGLGQARRHWVAAGILVMLFALVVGAASYALTGYPVGAQFALLGFVMMFLRGTRYLELRTAFGPIRFGFGKRAKHSAFLKAVQRSVWGRSPAPERPPVRVVAVCPACKKSGGPAVDPVTSEPTGAVLRVRAPCRDCLSKLKRRVAGRLPYRFDAAGTLDLVTEGCDPE